MFEDWRIPTASAKQSRTRSKSARNLHDLAPQTFRMLSHGTTPSQYLWSRFVMRNVLHRFRQRKERSARGAPSQCSTPKAIEYSSLSHQERRFRTLTSEQWWRHLQSIKNVPSGYCVTFSTRQPGKKFSQWPGAIGSCFLTCCTTVRGVRVQLCSEALRKRSQCNGLFSIGSAEAFTVDARCGDSLWKE